MFDHEKRDLLSRVLFEGRVNPGEVLAEMKVLYERDHQKMTDLLEASKEWVTPEFREEYNERLRELRQFARACEGAIDLIFDAAPQTKIPLEQAIQAGLEEAA